MLGSKTVKEVCGMDGGDIRIGADILAYRKQVTPRLWTCRLRLPPTNPLALNDSVKQLKLR
ncbi:MAG: hypothetical protein RPU64_07485 [Candidatus Sedimenticola sp. (ex Thyasira tokunagai)]